MDVELEEVVEGVGDFRDGATDIWMRERVLSFHSLMNRSK